MKITVAICTWNRAHLLARTLEEFNRVRSGPDMAWEVLVVDNGSTDGTSEMLQSLPSPGYPIRTVFEPRLGLSMARNRALAESTSDLIFYTDDDVLVDPGIVVALADAVKRHPNGSAFGGIIEPWFSIDPDPVLLAAFPALCRGFCGVDLQPHEGPLSAGHHLVGANMAFRRAHIEGLHFRDDLGPKGTETIGGDEIDFQDRLRARGGDIVWVPAMRLRHYVDKSRMTLSYLLRFAEEAGRKYVRLHGVPAGRRVGGVPRWLIGNAAKEHAQALISHARLNRTDALVHRRKGAEFLGMVKECRTAHLRGGKMPPPVPASSGQP